MRVGVARALVDSSILGFWGAEFTEMGDFLFFWTPMNRREKFNAASFILGGEIRKRTNTQTNSNRYTPTLFIGMCG